MKIILKKDVPNLGLAGEIVNAKDGYARNYLIPKGLAEEATPSGIAKAKEYQKAMAKRAQLEEEEARKLASDIGGLKMQIAMKAGEKGKLFGSVTGGDIAEFLAGKNITIDKKKIVMEESIKSLGSHEVHIKLHQEVVAKLEVEVLEAD